MIIRNDSQNNLFFIWVSSLHSVSLGMTGLLTVWGGFNRRQSRRLNPYTLRMRCHSDRREESPTNTAEAPSFQSEQGTSTFSLTMLLT
jgi:hypothetical protein